VDFNFHASFLKRFKFRGDASNFFSIRSIFVLKDKVEMNASAYELYGNGSHIWRNRTKHCLNQRENLLIFESELA
jgi:hypothetical protein